MVHSCPRCELRFPNQSEVATHLEWDHGVEQAADWGRLHYQIEGDDIPPLYDDREAAPLLQIMVVANQTLGGGRLQEALRERIQEGTRRVHVVVPATHSFDYVDFEVPAAATPGGARAGSGSDTDSGQDRGTDQRGLARARWRLQQAQRDFAVLGAQVTGEVGIADPAAAVTDALSRVAVDEVLISTLPRHLSRWVERDLEVEIRRHHDVRVTTILSD